MKRRRQTSSASPRASKKRKTNDEVVAETVSTKFRNRGNARYGAAFKADVTQVKKRDILREASNLYEKVSFYRIKYENTLAFN